MCSHARSDVGFKWIPKLFIKSEKQMDNPSPESSKRVHTVAQLKDKKKKRGLAIWLIDSNQIIIKKMMFASSFTTTLIPCLTISTSPSFPCKTTKLSASCFSLNNNAVKTTLKPSSLSTGRVFAAPEALDSQTTLDPLPGTLDGPGSDTFQVSL